MGANRSYVAGETIILPANSLGGALTGILFGPGAAGTALALSTPALVGQFDLGETLGAVWPIIITDLGGVASWGNDDSTADAVLARTALRTAARISSGKLVLVGVSMGYLSVANYALANPSLVQAVVGIIPVCNLSDAHGTFTAAIDAAYGGEYDDEVDGPTHNPYQYVASITHPTLLLTSSDDPTAPPEFAVEMSETNSLVTHADLGALGHSESAVAAAVVSVLSFLREVA